MNYKQNSYRKDIECQLNYIFLYFFPLFIISIHYFLKDIKSHLSYMFPNFFFVLSLHCFSFKSFCSFLFLTCNLFYKQRVVTTILR